MRMLTAVSTSFILLSAAASAATNEQGLTTEYNSNNAQERNDSAQDRYDDYRHQEGAVTRIEYEGNEAEQEMGTTVRARRVMLVTYVEPNYVDTNNNGMRDTYANYPSRDNSVLTQIEKMNNEVVNEAISRNRRVSLRY